MNAVADGRAPTILTRAGAERKTQQCRTMLERASSLLVELYRGRAHEALGFDSWQAYVAERFGDLRGIRIEVPDRIELVVGLTRPLVEGGQGMTRRRAAEHLGVSVGTVQHDLELAGVIDLTARREQRAAAVVVEALEPEPPVAMNKRDRAVQLVGEQGERGLTALELAEVTGWTGGSSTGTMSDLGRQRRVTRTEQYRRGYAAYVVPEVADTP